MNGAAIDLSDYTLAELKGLLFDIDTEIQRRRDDERGQAQDQARRQILDIVEGAGLSLDQLLEPASSNKPPRKKH